MKPIALCLLSLTFLSFSPATFAGDPMAQLGVATRSADKAVTDVLGLSEGIGLIIEDVVEGSAAEEAGLQRNDLLHTFDGQLLTSPRQLAVLVRSKKPKDKVGINYLRKGKAADVKVQLGATERTELPQLNENAFGFKFEPPTFEMLFDREGLDGLQKEMEKNMEQARKQFEQQLGGQLGDLGGNLEDAAREMEKQMEQLFNGQQLQGAFGQLGGELQNMLNDENLGEALQDAFGQLGNNAQAFAFGAHGSAKQTIQEDGMTFSFSVEDEKKHFNVRDEDKGKDLFDGPVNTEAERAKVPADLMAKLKQMEKNTKLGGGNGVFQFDFNIGPGAPMFGARPPVNGRRGQNQPQASDKPSAPKVQDGVVSIIDDELTVSISERDGEKHCRAVDPDGKVLFDGPIVTEAEQAKLPEEVREVLEDMNALPDPAAAKKRKQAEVEDDEEL